MNIPGAHSESQDGAEVSPTIHGTPGTSPGGQESKDGSPSSGEEDARGVEGGRKPQEDSTSATKDPDTNGVLPTSGPPSSEADEDEDATVEIYKPMPNDWVHPYGLVIAAFSKLSDNPCNDLRLDFTSGPEVTPEKRGRKGEASDAESTEDDAEGALGAGSASAVYSLLSSESIRHMPPPGHT